MIKPQLLHFCLAITTGVYTASFLVPLLQLQKTGTLALFLQVTRDWPKQTHSQHIKGLRADRATNIVRVCVVEGGSKVRA